jgi:hypothetical protein
MLRHPCDDARANKGHDSQAIQGQNRSITSTAFYTAPAPIDQGCNGVPIFLLAATFSTLRKVWSVLRDLPPA